MSRLATAIIAVLVIAVAGQWVMNARLTANLSMSNEENASLRLSITRTNEALEVYQESHSRDTLTLHALDAKIKELNAYAASLPDGAARCLSSDDTVRLRGLWD